jgi:hypothetical protein
MDRKSPHGFLIREFKEDLAILARDLPAGLNGEDHVSFGLLFVLLLGLTGSGP